MHWIKENWFKIGLLIIILVGIISGSYYFHNRLQEQESMRLSESIQREREYKDQQDQEKKEYVIKRKKDCYDIEISERKIWGNVSNSFYDDSTDTCGVKYKDSSINTNDCEEFTGDFKNSSESFLDCKLGLFTKRF